MDQAVEGDAGTGLKLQRYYGKSGEDFAMLRLTMFTRAPLVSVQKTMSDLALVLIAIAAVLSATPSFAQTTPGPGSTNPTPSNPQAKPGATMVINPTEDECRRGWNQTLKWTKDQFEQFCAQMKASK